MLGRGEFEWASEILPRCINKKALINELIKATSVEVERINGK